METRRLILGMLLGIIVILLWQPLFYYLGKKLGYDMDRHALTQQPATQPSPHTPATAPVQTHAPATASVVSTLRVLPAQTVGSARIGSERENDPNYRMAAVIESRGAGLQSVLLNEFRRSVKSQQRYVIQQPYTHNQQIWRPLATQSVVINGVTVDLADIDWQLEAADQSSATFSVMIADQTGPVARLRKTFQIPMGSDPSRGYELIVAYTIENLSGQPLNARAIFNGPVLPPSEQDHGGDRYTLAGYAADGYVEIVHDLVEYFTAEKPSKDYSRAKNGHPLLWAGMTSIYFSAIVRPLPLENIDAPPTYIQSVTADALNPQQQYLAMTFSTTLLKVEPGKTLSLPMRVFFGPRLRKLLNSDYYSAFPLSFDRTLVLTQGACAWCTFQWLIDLLVWLLGLFHVLFRDWGLAIIALVILVRAILHPITKKSQVSMSKMSKMAPEVERLKKKYGDNKEELNKAMMQLYKEQGVAPMLGCLPMFLQMPIWIALWQSLQTTFELRQAPFLWGFTWIHDLSKPDHLLTWEPIPLIFGWHLSALNLLPILMGVVFWLQTKFQPKPLAMTREQEQQQKMMQWMTLLFPLMLYSGPSGLNLYILTSTAIGIVESKIIRDHIRQQEEAEKAGRVIIDAGKKFRPVKPLTRDKTKPQGWWSRMLDRAEQIRSQIDKRK